MGGYDWFAISVALIAAVAGAATDIWKHRVYNVLTLPLFFSGMIYHGVSDGWSGLTMSAFGAVIGFAVLIMPHLLGLMGAGDVKLLAALGAWLGPTTNITVFVISSLLAGAYAVTLIIMRGKLQESWATLRVIVFRFAAFGAYMCKDDLVEELDSGVDRRLRVIPYGAMLPLGIVGALAWSLYFN